MTARDRSSRRYLGAALRFIAVLIGAYFAWLLMLALHECGHILHAWLSGGRVVKVSLPLLGFSQTIVHPNPREHFVVWGGPVWGALAPLLACAVFVCIRRRVPNVLRFFAGFCLIANGAYIGAGWVTRAGDAGDLLRLGTPVWYLIAFGIVCATSGLLLWHKTSWLSRRVSNAAK